ncbi:hypothetical protein [Pacificoceanicola onchidii]|uniref:hypothetical protein n=1 Tax=Pacificoceanicola onchidii TaxID=2562685 RepID=UPI0010A67741|nr:hypothetical protein [Pacificoceanicola onchidii]
MSTDEFERRATQKLIEAVADSVVHEGVGSLVSGPILDAFGWSEADKQAEYFNAIMDRLHVIQGQISDVQDSIHKVQTAIKGVEYAIADEETQSILRSFRNPASKIDEKFATYAEALSGLVSGDQDLIDEAARELSNPEGALNPHEISELLAEVQDIFLPEHSGMTGLLEVQAKVIEAAIVSGAQPDPIEWFGFDPKFEAPEFQMRGGLWSGESIYIKAKDIGEQILGGQIAETFRWVLGTQLKGLILLATAWKGSIHEPRVTAHAKRLTVAVFKIEAFLNSANPVIDKSVSIALKTNGKPMGPPYTKGGYPWLKWPHTKIECPFGGNDIIWKSLPYDTPDGDPNPKGTPYILVMIQSPWAPWPSGYCRISEVEKCQLDTKHFSLSYKTPSPDEPKYNARIESYDRPLPGKLHFIVELAHRARHPVLTEADMQARLDSIDKKRRDQGEPGLSPEVRDALLHGMKDHNG